MTLILVVEDEKNIREDIRTILEFEGYSAIEANNGRVGLEKVQQTPPALIFCDVVMPEMDGYQLLHALRKSSEYAKIPFIFVSAKASTEDIQQGLSAGADAYLKKPFTSSDLLETINRFLPDSPSQ